MIHNDNYFVVRDTANESTYYTRNLKKATRENTLILAEGLNKDAAKAVVRTFILNRSYNDETQGEDS